jgi:hypothetical protein
VAEDCLHCPDSIRHLALRNYEPRDRETGGRNLTLIASMAYSTSPSPSLPRAPRRRGRPRRAAPAGHRGAGGFRSLRRRAAVARTGTRPPAAAASRRGRGIGRRRGGKGDRGGKYRSPLQQIVIWRVKFFGGSSKHTFTG